MPELVSECTPAPAPPPVPPGLPSYAAGNESARHPAHHRSEGARSVLYLRETFMVYVTDQPPYQPSGASVLCSTTSSSTSGGSGPSIRRGSSGPSCGPSLRICVARKAPYWS